MEEDVIYEEEYLKHVNELRFTQGDYGRWVRFSDSYPPVYSGSGTLIEVLICGNPTYQCVFKLDDGTIRFRDIDFNREFSWGEYEELYWRFIPDPPSNLQYNVG